MCLSRPEVLASPNMPGQLVIKEYDTKYFEVCRTLQEL
jgi:hypothetical protein